MATKMKQPAKLPAHFFLDKLPNPDHNSIHIDLNRLGRMLASTQRQPLTKKDALEMHQLACDVAAGVDAVKIWLESFIEKGKH